MKKMQEIKDTFEEIKKIILKNFSDVEFNFNVLPCSHDPKHLEKRKVAVYIFIHKNKILKIGKVSRNNDDIFFLGHYQIQKTISSLARSIAKDLNSYDKNEMNDITRQNFKKGFCI